MAVSFDRRLITGSDRSAVAKIAADRMLARIGATTDSVAICLTGGSSPQALYRLLATDGWRDRVPWSRVHWFIGDERFVPANDPLSNMGAARRTFLDRCAPASNIHPIPTESDNPDEAALCYERELRSFYGANSFDPVRPLFDLVLMGVGPDGHTASLFPRHAALSEATGWVVGVPESPVAPFVPRITLTLPALGCSREMLFEVTGSGKRAILTRVLAGENLPANRAHSMTGDTIWLVDRAALPENLGAR
jgi:6-phosphogluconolactonase